MPNTATNERNSTTTCDGWSRDSDGFIHMPELRAFQIYGALMHDPKHLPAYALNFEVSRGMSYTDFLDVNDICTQGATA